MSDTVIEFSVTMLVLLGLAIVLSLIFKTIIIFDYERGVVYRNGKFHRILSPGLHWLFARLETAQKVDIRKRFITIPGQEVLSADNVNIKVSVVAVYHIEDPYKALTNTASYMESLYLILQLGLRDLFSSTPIEELLTKRPEMSKQLFEKTTQQVSEIGLVLLSADIKDFMFPGDLKNIFAQIVNARNEGLAALERARGESAALRNLANAAKVLENNPALLQLRILQAIESKGGNTIVFSTPQEIPGLLPVTTKKK